ncbi:MAG: type II toxin-antitoxin system VapC family toxin [Waterburya sp.]
MNGNRCLLDTNAIIALLKGDSSLIKLLQDANWLGISIISQIEFLAFSGLTETDIELFRRFLQRVEVINLNDKNELLIEQVIIIRQQYRLKLPDAIIAAMAKQNSAKLITRDWA